MGKGVLDAVAHVDDEIYDALVGFDALDQRRTAATVEQRLAEIDQANADAQAQADALKTDAEIERIAREQYGYAKAGEEVYHLLPEAQDPVRVPDAWPFEGLGSSLTR